MMSEDEAIPLFPTKGTQLKLDESETKAKTPTYKHAQREAMKRGDTDTYFMRKRRTSKGSKKKRAMKR